MKFDRKKIGNKWIPYAVAGCVTVVVYLFLSHLNVFGAAISKLIGFVMPVIIGIVMAYVMDPLVNIFYTKVFLKMKNPVLRRNLSIVCTVVLVLLFFVILLVALIPQVIERIVTFLGNIESYAESLQKLLGSLEKKSSEGSAIDISGLITSGSSLLDKITDVLPKNMDSLVDTSVNIGKNVMMLVIEFILAIYFLVDKKNLQNGFKKFMQALLSRNSYRSGANLWSRCNRILVRFIACEFLDALIVGAANSVFMLIAGLPYNALISVVVGVTNLAPTFGPIVGGVIGAFILLMVNPWYALWFLIFTVILQTVDGYLLKPKLYGGQLGVSSVWILIAIVVGGRIFGVVGILLAIPAAAIIDILYKESFLPWLQRRRAKADSAQEPEKKITN